MIPRCQVWILEIGHLGSKVWPGVRRCILPTGILDDLQLYHWILIDLKKIFDQIQVKTLTSEYQTVGWWLTKPSHVVDYG